MKNKIILSALLLCFSTSVFAQMKELPSIRTGVGSRETNASFAIGMSRDSGETFITSAGATETVSLIGTIRPEAQQVGLTANIYMAIRFNGEFFQLTSEGEFIPWNFNVPDLMPFQTDFTLQEENVVTYFNDKLSGRIGNNFLFIGYKASDSGRLYYTSSALKVTMSELSTREQARALFNSSVSPDTLQTRCIVCHVSGGQAAGFGAYTLLRTSSTNHLESNFDTFETLLNSRGASFILSKASGGQSHVGGVQITTNSQNYQDLESFLTLLGQ